MILLFFLVVCYFENSNRLFLIRECRHNWHDHVQPLVHLYVDYFIFCVLELIFSYIKAYASITI